MVGVRGRSGRKTEFKDMYHILVRQKQREYTERNREVINYAHRHKISVGEARKRLRELKHRAFRKGVTKDDKHYSR